MDPATSVSDDTYLTSAAGEAELGAGLRILAVGNMYPPQHTGGYEVMWQAAMDHARSLGCQVRVLVSEHRQPGAGNESDPDVHRTLRWYWDQRRYEFPQLSLTQRIEVERHNAAQLSRHLEEFRPHVVAWWSMGCMSLALIERVRRAGLPAVFVVHDDWLIYGRHHDQWIRMWRGRRRLVAPVVERLLGIPTRVELSSAGSFVFNSRYTLDRARGVGVDAPRMRVVHPGIADPFLNPLPTEPWRWRLTYVGRIDRQKGVDTAVRALAQLPSAATLTVWGGGDDSYLEDMRTLAAELGVGHRLRFEGWADTDGLLRAYSEADAVVFPVRWEEPFGLVPLEAMGLGRPVIATARGGTAEFVRDGDNAVVFDVDDVQGLADSVRRMAGDEELRARLRDGGRRTAVQYTVREFARRTVEEIIRTRPMDRADGSARRTPARIS